MSTNNKHICIFFCYNNFEHIVKCFESVKNLPLDFFIIENFSKNSDKIETYFKQQNLKGYVRFEKNITNNAVDIIKKDFEKLFESYDYITFSDCDLFVEDSKSLIDEIYQILDYDDVGVCCSHLSMDNLPNVPGADKWVPTPISIHEDYLNTNTGIYFMTLKQKNYHLIKNIKFKDHIMCLTVRGNGLKWAATKQNQVVHLTWDLYYEGSEYYNFKIKNLGIIWSHSERCDYEIIK